MAAENTQHILEGDLGGDRKWTELQHKHYYKGRSTPWNVQITPELRCRERNYKDLVPQNLFLTIRYKMGFIVHNVQEGERKQYFIKLSLVDAERNMEVTYDGKPVLEETGTRSIDNALNYSLNFRKTSFHFQRGRFRFRVKLQRKIQGQLYTVMCLLSAPFKVYSKKKAVLLSQTSNAALRVGSGSMNSSSTSEEEELKSNPKTYISNSNSSGEVMREAAVETTASDSSQRTREFVQQSIDHAQMYHQLRQLQYYQQQQQAPYYGFCYNPHPFLQHLVPPPGSYEDNSVFTSILGKRNSSDASSPLSPNDRPSKQMRMSSDSDTGMPPTALNLNFAAPNSFATSPTGPTSPACLRFAPVNGQKEEKVALEGADRLPSCMELISEVDKVWSLRFDNQDRR